MNFNRLKALMIREYWEHKGLLFRTPLTISLILVLLSGIAIFQAASIIPVSKSGNTFQFEYKDGSSIKINPDEPIFNREEKTIEPQKSLRKNGSAFGNFNTKAVSGLVSVATFFGALLSLLYLSQSLYSDRKDKSILFWRSIPTSEWETIGSKLLTAMWIFPFVFSAFAIITAVLCFIILYIAAYTLGLDSVLRHTASEFAHFNLIGFFKFFVGVSIFIVLFLPVYCWFLFSSAVSTKSPLLVSLGIPIAILIAEGVILHSRNFGEIIKQYGISLFSNVSAIHDFNWGDINVISIAISIVVSVMLLLTTHWLRNNRYEM